VVGHAWGPVAGWLRGLCLAAAALMVIRSAPLQVLGLVVYAAILVLSARRRGPAPAVSAAA